MSARREDLGSGLIYEVTPNEDGPDTVDLRHLGVSIQQNRNVGQLRALLFMVIVSLLQQRDEARAKLRDALRRAEGRA